MAAIGGWRVFKFHGLNPSRFAVTVGPVKLRSPSSCDVRPVKENRLDCGSGTFWDIVPVP